MFLLSVALSLDWQSVRVLVLRVFAFFGAIVRNVVFSVVMKNEWMTQHKL